MKFIFWSFKTFVFESFNSFIYCWKLFNLQSKPIPVAKLRFFRNSMRHISKTCTKVLLHRQDFPPDIFHSLLSTIRTFLNKINASISPYKTQVFQNQFKSLYQSLRDLEKQIECFFSLKKLHSDKEPK
jgi:hypothetical protein